MKKVKVKLTLALPLLFMLLCPNLSKAQIAVADELFDNFEFLRAAQYYNSASLEAALDEEHLMRFGYCYIAIQDYQAALPLYEKIVALKSVRNIHFYYYAEALKNTGRYDQAARMYIHYASLEPDDYRAKAGEKSCRWLMEHPESNSVFTVRNAGRLNGAAADLCPVPFEKGYLYISEKATGKKSPLDLVNNSKDPQFLAELQYGSDLIPAPGFFYSSDGQTSTAFYPGLDSAYIYGPPCLDTSNGKIYLSARSNKTDPANALTESSRMMVCKYDRLTGKSSYLEDFRWSAEYLNFTLGFPNMSLSPDRKLLVFPSSVSGGFGGTDLYACRMTDSLTWSRPYNLGALINTPGNELFPVFSDQGQLYYSSDGFAGYGNLDILMSAASDTGWLAPRVLPRPFNAEGDDFYLASADKGFNGMFTSNRKGGAGDDDLWIYEFTTLAIKGRITDKTTSKTIAGVSLQLKDASGKIAGNFTTTEEGQFIFTGLKVNSGFELNVSAEGYLVQNFQVSTGMDFSPELFYKTSGEPELPLLELALEPKIQKREIILTDILYNFDSWKLRSESCKALDELADILNSNKDILILINSHTDERGPALYNNILSERRAQSVINYLSEKNADMSRLAFKGWGESSPLKKNAKTRAEHQANRRTTFNVVSDGIIPQGYKKAEYRKLPSGRH